MIFYTNVFQRNGKFFVRGYGDDGEPFANIVKDYEPYIFLPVSHETGWKTIYGQHVQKRTFPNLGSIYKWMKEQREISNAPEYYGLTNFVYTYINDTFPGVVKYNHDFLSVVSCDIEVESRNGFPDVNAALEKVTAITLVKNGKSITFGCKDFKPHRENVEYVKCDSEEDLLRRFLITWNSADWAPDIVTGWSFDLFDLPYLVHRITRLLGEQAAKRLSPFGFVEAREVIRAKGSTYKQFDDRKEVVYELGGITVLDYLQLYKKFSGAQQPSYALNAIAKLELGKEKVKYKGSLDELYDTNPQLYYEYNIEDSILVDEMETKKKFIRFVVSLAYEAKITFNDALVTLRPWDVIIHNFLLDRFIVIPQYKKKPWHDIIGGYVKNAQIGLHRWVVSFDFASLYPTILVQNNISPDTFIDKPAGMTDPAHVVGRDMWPVITDDYTYCANGMRFSKEKQGFIPEVVALYMTKRDNLKKEMKRLAKEDKKKHAIQIGIYDSQQQAVKILNNGLYGALTNEYFRWAEADFGEAVTSTAQCCTRYVEKRVNEWLNKIFKTQNVDYVIAADTDSIYVTLDPLINELGANTMEPQKIVELIDRMCKKKIGPFIASVCNDLHKKFNVFKPKLNMKQEVIAEKVIWRAPKMYAMNIWDMEGVRNKEPELKVKGMEIVRSSTPLLIREKLKEAVSIIMNKSEKEFQDYVEKFRSEYDKLPFSVIANPRSVDGIKKYADPVTICSKGTPFHVRGALIYNHALVTLGLDKKYPPIKDKDKIRFVYLKEPNPFNTHVIAAPEELPVEFEMEQYIDRQLQFEKTFLTPIQSLTQLINWRCVPINTLEDFL